MKRRRPGRKRKRRPQNKAGQQHYEDISSDDIITGRSPPRWPKRPLRLDQRDENSQWTDEMMAEEPYRPYRNYNRRRLYPKYDDELREDIPEDANKENRKYDDGQQRQDIEEIVTEKIEDRPNRRAYPKRKYTKTDVVTPSSSPVDLKAILKQSGGISLSELLQQRNLSLADLLKGEQHAISALTSIPEQTSEPYDKYMQNDESDRRYSNYNRRLPPIRKYQKPDEEITTGSENLVPEQPNEDITTERRIFVPSHPKYYTSVDYKPNMNELNNIQTQTTSLSSTSTTSTEQPEQTSESVSIISSTVTFSTSENPTIMKTKLKNRPRYTLPPTLAKLKNIKTTMKTIINTETENYPKISPVPAKAIKINLNELFGMPKLAQNIPVKSTTDGPMKISVNIGQIIEKSRNGITPDDSVEESTKKTEKVKELTAKDEIMEVLSDSVSRENLTRLLELRNMTLDELVEQRERGSSQRHLADIFHNQTKEPEPTDEMVIDVVKSNENTFLQPPSLFETFPAFDLRPDNNIQTTHYTRESRENQFNSKETSNDILGNVMVPVWRQAYTNTNQKQKAYSMPDKYLQDDLIINDETRRIEDIENKLVEAVNGALNIDVINHKTYDDVQEEENEFFRLPYGVRSAIIASAVIVGISILIFLTIFIVFKWTQRQKRQLNYTNSFSSKIKTPILETPYQRRIFTSIMNSTFGRKKKMPTISCSDPHSLQEYLWENDRKPFQ